MPHLEGSGAHLEFPLAGHVSTHEIQPVSLNRRYSTYECAKTEGLADDAGR